MPANHPNHRPAACGLLIALLLVSLIIPAVSAAEYNFELDDSTYNEQTSLPTGILSPIPTNYNVNHFYILNANEVYGNELVAVYSVVKGGVIENYNALPQFAATSVTIGDFMTGVFGYYKYQSEFTDYLECYLINIEYINDYPTGLTGRQSFLMVPDDPNFVFPIARGFHYNDLTGDYNLKFAIGSDDGYYAFHSDFKYDSIFRHNWKQNLIINTSDYHDSIKLIRNGLPSTIYIETPSLSFTNNPNDNSDYLVYLDALNDRPYLISVKNPTTNKYFNYTVNLDGLIGYTEPDEPDTDYVTIYIRNSQTGALLANASVVIQDTTTDPWMEVTNQTLTSGHGTFSLPKDPGFHPTQYRIGATVPGYQQVVPALFFRVVGPTNVVVEMEPIEGGPVNEDNAYLEFYVRDLNANGIPNAQVFVDGKLRWTNAAGYTQIEVAKNASYPYSVSKSGYVTIEGTATVGAGPRYVVNVVLGPKEIPTNPPATDPGGPGATPTPDRRTNEEKGQAVIDMLADNAEGLGALALICLMFGLLKLMVKW